MIVARTSALVPPRSTLLATCADRRLRLVGEIGFRRPSDRLVPTGRASMTKQAMNYLLGELEARGYIERRAERGSSRRLVFLTKRGWQVRETILAAVTEVEAEWTSVLGQRRFDEFMNTLRQLWSIRQPDVQSTDGRGVARRRDDRPEPSLPRRG